MRKMNNIWDEYSKIELIGSGAFSKVYRAKRKLNNEYVAIKEIHKTRVSKNTLLNEIKIIKELKSENSVSLIDSIETNDSYYLVLELCLISLDEYIKKRGSPLSIEEIKEILINLNESFKEMKNKNIIHRDLKPSNILLSISKSKIDKMCFKISDFGLSKLFEENEMSLISSKGTSLTMAPEVLKGENDLIGYKSDIWSLGIIIYYMLFKEYPYNGNTEIQINQEINKKNKLKPSGNKELDDLINKMLIINVDERISWENYFKHPFFNKDKMNQSKLPVFNLKCKEHLNELIGYCPDCKCNLCLKCYNQHFSKTHRVLFFSQIGFSEEEIKEINDVCKNIENKITKLTKMKEEILNFINEIKVIKENSSVYKNDNENNYKHYSIECLKIINEQFNLTGEITVPKLHKWVTR